MKKALFALLLPCSAFAQDASDTDSSDPHTKKFVRIVSISGYSGGDFYRDGFEDRTIFQQAAPQSSLPFADISGYTNYDGWYPTFVGNFTTGMNVNVHLRCQKKFGELRAGIAHTTISVASQYYSMQTITPMDTTTLPGGQWLISDSVATSVYDYTWNSDLIQLNVAWIVRSDPRRWFNLYTGVGFTGGIGYNGTIAMSHWHNSHYNHHSTNYGPNYSTNHETIVSVEERYKAPGFTTFSIYAPVGWNLRLGNRKNLWSHLALFGEYNGAIMFLNTSVGITKIRTVSSMYAGVRWYVHAPAKPKNKGRERRHRHPHENNGEQK